MNIRFYEWPSTSGYFLVLCDGMDGQLGNVDVAAPNPTIEFRAYSATVLADKQTREEIYAAVDAFIAKKQAARDVAERLQS